MPQCLLQLTCIFILLISSSAKAYTFGASDGPLPADKAFKLFVKKDGTNILITWEIAPGYYLYKEHISVKIGANEQAIKLPNNSKKITTNVPELKQVEVFDQFLAINIATQDLPQQELFLEYQGCAASGFCYSPISKKIIINHNDISYKDATDYLESTNKNISTTDKLQDILTNTNIITTTITFFLMGLLLSFTPCVLPMIPIVLNIITSGHNNNKKFIRISMTLIYVISMATTFAALGFITGLLGYSIQGLLQNYWIIIPLVIFLCALAFVQLGYMPNVPYLDFSNRIIHYLPAQSWLKPLILGSLSAIVISPCTTPALLGILIYLSQEGSALIGAYSLWVLGFSMGIPLLFIACGANFLPTSGPWLDTVKSIAGFLLLALAIWLLDRIVHPLVTVLLTGMLSLGISFWLTWSIKQNKDKFFLKAGIALCIGIFGIILLYQAIVNNNIAFNPLSSKTTIYSKYNKVNSLEELQQQLAIAKQNSIPTMLFISADWCHSCKQLEAKIHSNSFITEKLEVLNILIVDLSKLSVATQNIIKEYDVYGPPAILFFDKNGKEIKELRITEILSNEKLEHIFSIYS